MRKRILPIPNHLDKFVSDRIELSIEAILQDMNRSNAIPVLDVNTDHIHDFFDQTISEAFRYHRLELNESNLETFVEKNKWLVDDQLINITLLTNARNVLNPYKEHYRFALREEAQGKADQYTNIVKTNVRELYSFDRILQERINNRFTKLALFPAG